MRRITFMTLLQITFSVLLFYVGSSWAQCANPIVASCNVYASCFARYCPCDVGSQDEYFISYGEKYCRRFLDVSTFSSAGAKWRDDTLRCPNNCNCSKMRTFAFDSHVACYTQANSSICALPLVDVLEIRKVIDAKDLFTSDGWKQMREVAKICKSTAPDDGRRTVWSGLEVILSTR
jgi:hypothetical protein